MKDVVVVDGEHRLRVTVGLQRSPNFSLLVTMASLFCLQGPTLPQFSTLLIKGTYFPSAPIHLCVSHLKASSHAQGRALFLTPNREVLAAALEDYGDGWMTTHCMTGAYAALFSRIDMLYAPSSHRNPGDQR